LPFRFRSRFRQGLRCASDGDHNAVGPGVHHTEEQHLVVGSELDTGHAGCGSALGSHGVRRESQQLPAGGDEQQMMSIVRGHGGSDDAIS
jgi:hypothetical protein